MISWGAAMSAARRASAAFNGCKKTKCEFVRVVERNKFRVDATAGKGLALFRWLPVNFIPTILFVRPGHCAARAG
jgi:hypothetical protein